MECQDAAVSGLSWTLIVGGGLYLWRQTRTVAPYGRYVEANRCCCPARLAWFLQEVPSFLLPLLLLSGQRDAERQDAGRRLLLLGSFMLHYFHRSFIYAFLTRGRPVPLLIVLYSAIFCSLNGFLQGHYLLHCSRLEDTWLTDAHLAAGLLVFVVGMTVNIHSDHILRSLRKPGETVYRIPHGGMFELVSGANFFGEIVQWCGFVVAARSLPAFAFFFFTVCSIGPRAYQHHRDYQLRFEDYPRCRKALVPFIL
ncbi:3-oxo-5-alpha-steroid 4-dehydrogenase 2-like [Acanthochromis polyacanthus]|uniref:3-oxo-5-alpha-steroid 4-dehydrogenase n=1 Tax=Acanthochromis polyacanthus TaxID=80966 RepID=A0A3Q1H9Q5_9TELE|nr:3-oxo-5-alpha-steroid 4-dehydrogenase 2-like [Acanthochromis polyacanthus]